MNNKLNKFLINEIDIGGNINWDYASSSFKKIDFSEVDNILLNNIAFSFLNKDEKEKLFSHIKNKTLNDDIKNELLRYFNDYFEHLIIKYPIKNNLYKEFSNHFFNWVEIINGVVDDKSIDKILTNIHSQNNLLWLSLIKELHSRRLFDENYKLITKKKNKFKKSDLYEDMLMYQIFSITSNSKYLYNTKKIKELLNLAKQINSYTANKIFIELECALLQNNKSSFEFLLSKNEDLVNEFTVLELLYIYEFAVLIHSEFAVNLINKYLYRRDIESYDNSQELFIYEFYNFLYKEDYPTALSYVRKLNDRGYNFKHIIWYLKNNSKGKSYLIAMESIIN